MDKHLLERVSIGIQVLGYGLFYYLFFIVRLRLIESAARAFYDYGIGSMLDNLNRGQLFYLFMSLVVPILIRWMLTGNFHIIPLTHNYLKELNEKIRD